MSLENFDQFGMRLRIVLGPVLPFSVMVPYITAFYGKDMATRLRFLRGAMGSIWDALLTRQADFAIGTTGDPPAPGFAYWPIGMVAMEFCMSPAHPLVGETEPLPQQKIAQSTVMDDNVQPRGMRLDRADFSGSQCGSSY